MFSMRTTPQLQDWNFQALMVVQAMVGMLSPNFRRITLDHDGCQWLITFVLEREDAEDREEIEDFETEWDALQSGPEPCEVAHRRHFGAHALAITAGAHPVSASRSRFLTQTDPRP